MARKLSNPAFSPLERYLFHRDEVYFSDDSRGWADAEVESFAWRGVDFSIDLSDLPNRKPRQTSVLLLGSLGAGSLEISRLLGVSVHATEGMISGLRSPVYPDDVLALHAGNFVQSCFEKGYLRQNSPPIPLAEPLDNFDTTIIRGVAAGRLNKGIVEDLEDANLCRDTFSSHDLSNHMQELYEKFGLVGRQSLVLFGHAAGVLSRG